MKGMLMEIIIAAIIMATMLGLDYGGELALRPMIEMAKRSFREQPLMTRRPRLKVPPWCNWTDGFFCETFFFFFTVDLRFATIPALRHGGNRRARKCSAGSRLRSSTHRPSTRWEPRSTPHTKYYGRHSPRSRLAKQRHQNKTNGQNANDAIPAQTGSEPCARAKRKRKQ